MVWNTYKTNYLDESTAERKSTSQLPVSIMGDYPIKTISNSPQVK
jgi:hypothetical protein